MCYNDNRRSALKIFFHEINFLEDTKMALPVAVQLYSVRGDVEKDMRAALLKVKEMDTSKR